MTKGICRGTKTLYLIDKFGYANRALRFHKRGALVNSFYCLSKYYFSKNPSVQSGDNSNTGGFPLDGVGTYYVFIMPFDQHGEDAEVELYFSSNELPTRIA